MKKIIFTTAVIAALTSLAYAKQLRIRPEIAGKKFNILQQEFVSHDSAGTDRDTIAGQSGDYIKFSNNGLAYTYFDNKYDTLEYKLIGIDSLSFGDTPFLIITSNSDKITLYQNEREENGDYNSVWYKLSANENQTLRAKK